MPQLSQRLNGIQLVSVLEQVWLHASDISWTGARDCGHESSQGLLELSANARLSNATLQTHTIERSNLISSNMCRGLVQHTRAGMFTPFRLKTHLRKLQILPLILLCRPQVLLETSCHPLPCLMQCCQQTPRSHLLRMLPAHQTRMRPHMFRLCDTDTCMVTSSM